MKKKASLDKEEKEMVESIERGEWTSAGKKEVDRHTRNVREFLVAKKKEARVNIRISQDVLEMVKSIAAEEGLAYQTLLNSVIFKFATGRLIERKDFAAEIRQAIREALDKAS